MCFKKQQNEDRENNEFANCYVTILSPREEQNLQVFNNKVARKIRGLVEVEESAKFRQA
jgi:hypothetical protein